MEELRCLRDACKGYREKALVEFLVSTGCRLSEVAQLRAADLDLVGRTVKVTGKGDKDRVVYFQRPHKTHAARVFRGAEGR